MPAPDPTVHRHDGFYLRLGLGAGFLASSLDAPIGKISARGGGLALEFSLGGTVADGLVIGGGLWVAGTSSVTLKGNFPGSPRDGGNASLGLLGVLADYYPNPNEGFHVQGGLGIGTLSFEKNVAIMTPLNMAVENWSGGGGGAMLGVGYEFWVGKQWSIGGLARLLLMSGSLRGEDTGVTFDGKGYAPSILFAATNH